MAKREEFDVCVIGTGAGGGVMIQELTAAGFKVVALQRGPFLQRTDFSDDELATTVRDEIFSPHLVETWRADESHPAVAGRYSSTAQCVGGTMTRWAAWSWRYRRDDFKALSAEGPVEGASLADWPIDYEELEPYYERAEWEFGVSGDGGANPFAPLRKKEYPNPPHPARASSSRVAAGAQRLGYHPFPTPVAINSQPYGGRPRCLYGGNCAGYGCPVHAKATTLSVCIPKALATRRLDLRPNAVAHEITLGKDGRAKSVRFVDWKGRSQEVFARTVVVAGNAVGSAHLLLSSKSGSFPQGLANSSGLVGRNLMFHTMPLALFRTDESALGFSGMSSHVAVDDLHPSDTKRGFVRGGVIVERNDLTAQPIVYSLFSGQGREKGNRLWGTELKKFLGEFPRTIAVGAVLEDLPMEANRVDLDPNVKDSQGLPVPRMTHRQHPNDLAMHRWFEEKLLEIAEACGAREKWISRIPGVSHAGEETSIPGGLYVLGTCRMGEDPKTSVLDRWCRAHDVKNLWVVDGSCFPTSGGYSPTLTILANAYRVAEYLIAEAKRQNL